MRKALASLAVTICALVACGPTLPEGDVSVAISQALKPSGSGKAGAATTEITSVRIQVTRVEFLASEPVVADDGTVGQGRPAFDCAQPRTVDLMGFMNGNPLVIGTARLVGEIQQIRLITDGTAAVGFSDGTEKVAKIPSGDKSGLKILLKGANPGDFDYIYLVFDPAKSIHETGNGKLILRPVIKAFIRGEEVGSTEEPTDPTDPSDPSDPTDPQDPANPTDPNEPLPPM